MKNKQLCLLSLISSGLFFQSGVNASPLVSIGDHADLFFNGSSSLRWASNVFRNETNESDDLIWTVSPGFELDLGRGASNADFTVTTRYDILSYQDLSDLDTELFHIRADGSYRGSRLDLSASASYDESKTNSGDNNTLNDLIEFDTTVAKLDAEYRVSPKFSFGSGVRYSEREYGNYVDRFADRETVSLPLDVFYELTPKVDLSLGYMYSEKDVADIAGGTSGYTQESSFYNVGARGNLLPKLTGFFKAGYRTRDSNRVDADGSGSLGLDADLTWSATPKLSVMLGLSRDFGVAGAGDSTEDTSVDLSSYYLISTHFAASANVGYTLRDYTNGAREDDQYVLGLRFSYSPNQYWSFSTGYTYDENSSNNAGSSYENHTLDLTATLRY